MYTRALYLQPGYRGSAIPEISLPMNEFWQYGVGGLAVAIVGAAVRIFSKKKDRETSTESLHFEQVKFLLEASRTEMALLRTQNEKLREEVVTLRTEIATLNAHIEILESKSK